MHGLADFGLVEDHRESLLREAEERRLVRLLRDARRSEARRSRAGSGRDATVTVRWGLHRDDEKVAESLELNGMPRWVAFEERFVVAERDGSVLAALAYRTEPKRMLLGTLIADPWAGERGLAIVLYARVPGLAREMCAREIRVSPGSNTSYLREAGYHRGVTGWHVDVPRSSEDSDRRSRWWGKMVRLIFRHYTGRRALGG